MRRTKPGGPNGFTLIHVGLSRRAASVSTATTQLRRWSAPCLLSECQCSGLVQAIERCTSERQEKTGLCERYSGTNGAPCSWRLRFAASGHFTYLTTCSYEHRRMNGHGVNCHSSGETDDRRQTLDVLLPCANNSLQQLRCPETKKRGSTCTAATEGIERQPPDLLLSS